MTRVDLARVDDIPSGFPSVPAFAKESGGQALTTSVVDLAGATLSATPSVVETWLVWAIFDFEWTTANAGNLALGTVAFSGTGTVVGGTAILQGNTLHRATAGMLYVITGVSAEAHTVKLRVQKTGAGGAATSQGTSCIALLRVPE